MEKSINMDSTPSNRGESESGKYSGLQFCNDDEIEDSMDKSKRIAAILKFHQIDSE